MLVSNAYTKYCVDRHMIFYDIPEKKVLQVLSSMIEIWMKFMLILDMKFGNSSIFTNLWWSVVMDDWNLDEKTLNKWQ